MRQYPIRHDVKACIYKSSKSYGAKNTSEETIYVGSGKNNSHTLAKVCTTKRFKSNYKNFGSYVVFRISVDNIVLKEMIFSYIDGKTGDLLNEESYITGVINAE